MSSHRREPSGGRRRRRWRWRWIAGVLAGLFGLTLITLPWWFPAVLATALTRFGVDAASTRAAGYGSIRVQSLHFQNGGVAIDAREVLLPQPTALFWHRWFGASTTNPLIRVSEWQVRVNAGASNSPPPEPRPSVQLAAILDDVASQAAVLREWLPPLELSAGKVIAGGEAIEVTEGRWQPGELTAEARVASLELDTRIVLALEPTNRISLDLSDRSYGVTLGMELRPEGANWELAGQGQWRSNAFTFRARADRDTRGPWPERFELAMPDIRLPAEFVGLPGYSNLSGAVRLAGGGERYTVNARATAEPPDANLPPLRLELDAGLNPEEVRLDRFECRSAPLHLSLSNPVAWRWESRHLDRPCRLTLESDLTSQTWADLRGTLHGELALNPNLGADLRAEFRLSGDGLIAYGLPVPELDVTGSALGTRIERVELNAGLAGRSRVQVSGRGLDLASQTLAEGTLDLSLLDGLPEPWRLPVTWQAAKGSVAFRGALTNLEHRGTARLTGLRLPGVPAAEMACRWEGQRERRLAPEITLKTSGGQIELAGILEDLARLTLTTLAIRSGDESPLVLRAPVPMRFHHSHSLEIGSAWQLASEPLVLANADRMLALTADLDWPTRVNLDLGATNLDTPFIRPFLDRELPAATLESLAARFESDGGPARWDLLLAGRFEYDTSRVLRATGTLRGDAQGVHLSELRLRGDQAEELQLDGRVPMVVDLRRSGRPWEVRFADPLEVRFTAAAGGTLARWLSDRAGVACVRPRASGSITGSLTAPLARVEVFAEAIEASQGSPWADRVPRVERLELNLLAETNRIALDALTAQVEGVPLTASAALPLPAGFWNEIAGGRANVDWVGLSAGLRVTNLPLGALAARLAPWVRPEGSLSADVRLSPGRQWSGGAQFEGLGTRPFPGLGPLRAIGGRIRFEDQQVRLDGVEAELGGATARMDGWLDLPVGGLSGAALPAFDLQVRGQKLPLAREAGLVVRGDLDLSLRHAGTNTPALEGTVTLGRSVLLSDLKDIFGARVRATQRPPPFFSIATQPFSDWRLGVDIKGDEFLHLKSPFYSGVHSVNLRLRGTLEAPVLLGDAQIARGSVIFPYATLPVAQGIVAFTEEDPAHPRLQVRAAARSFGYDVRMEIGGDLSEPTVQFSSSPPLTSEEILLMITAGELPRHQVQYSMTDRLTKLGSILGKDLLRKFGSPDSGEDRLIIRSGEGISADGRVTHRVEYRLTDVWSLVGEYDEFDALNAGVKWRILRR